MTDMLYKVCDMVEKVIAITKLWIIFDFSYLQYYVA